MSARDARGPEARTRSADLLILLLVSVLGCRPLAPGVGGADAEVGDSATPKGYLAVQTRGCAACHQSPDPEEGVLSGQVTPVDAGAGSGSAYGSNLTPDPDTGMDAWDAGSIVQALRRGVDDKGATLCPAMPRYSDMADAEALAIAAYLQGLPAVWHPVPASACSLRKAADGG
jgi:mono/diheme cytochrome c family protein